MGSMLPYIAAPWILYDPSWDLLDPQSLGHLGNLVFRTRPALLRKDDTAGPQSEPLGL